MNHPYVNHPHRPDCARECVEAGACLDLARCDEYGPGYIERALRQIAAPRTFYPSVRAAMTAARASVRAQR